MATKLPDARDHGGGSAGAGNGHRPPGPPAELPHGSRKSPHSDSLLGRAATGCALAVMALGLAVITGWVLDIDPLKRVLPQLATMKFNTALGLLLAGAALCLREKSAFRLGLAGVVGLLGSLTLGQYFVAADFGIDQLFVRDAEAMAGLAPGRMSPATAVCFVLNGAALGLLGSRVSERWAEPLATAVGAVGFIALLGYSLGAENLYSIPGFASVALHTAAGLVLLAAGTLCAMPGGIVALLVRARGTARSLSLGFGALTALLIILGVVSASGLRSVGDEVDATAGVARPRAAASRELEVNVLDYVLEARSFLAGDAAARERRRKPAGEVAQLLATYEQLAETPKQRELAARFSTHWQALHARTETLVAAEKATTDELTSLIRLRLELVDFLDAEMQPDAVAASNARWATTQVALQNTEAVTLLLLIGAIVLALVTSGVVIRAVIGGEAGLQAEVAERKQAEDQVHLLNRDLERRVAERVEDLATKARLLVERNAEVELARGELEKKAAELARASGYKSQFLANMSHELRTPLNSILVFSQLLAQNRAGNLTEKQTEISRHISSSGADLLVLINDILDVSKIESGTVTVEIEEVRVAELQDTLERDFRHAAEAKNLHFNLHFAEGLPKFLISDGKRLQQILKNLLSNAVKFTAHGKVEVRVSMATQGWSADHSVLSKAPQTIAFAVEDTGIGIAPENQQLIFQAFQQADAGTSRNFGGTGLGLAISRELAALLGGEIKLASVHGQGSTFTLFLPVRFAGSQAMRPATTATTLAEAQHPRVPSVQALEREDIEESPERVLSETVLFPHRVITDLPEEEQAMLEKLHSSNQVLRGRKVLVVDDDARNIFALTSVLENHEMEVISTTSGREAIDLIQTTPDLSLVLMDIMMPEMDGYETMRRIRELREFRTLPILALTAKAMKGDRNKCLDAGASDYIAKPVNPHELVSLMRVWLFR